MVTTTPKSSVLLSAFGPFPGVPVNPTQEVVKTVVDALAPEGVDSVHHVVLPTTWEGAFDTLNDAFVMHKPDRVVMLGVASKRDHIELEHGANNHVSGAPDALGQSTCEGLVLPGAGKRLESALNIDKLALQLSELGPVKASTDCGSYLCNSTYFQALSHLSPMSIFVHIPPAETLPLVDTSRIIRSLVEILCNGLEPCDQAL